MRGELRPGGSGREWCDAEVVRRLRRASLAALRREIEPADPRALGRFLPDWQRVDRPGRRPRRRRPARGARAAPGARPAAPPSGRPRCSRGGWPTTARPGSTSWPPAGEVVWVGAGAGRGRRRAGGDLLPRGRAAARAAPRPTRRPRARWPTPCAPPWPRAPASGTTCWRPSPAPRGGRLLHPLGRWSGPARSPTTSGCRCARRGACRRCQRPERRARRRRAGRRRPRRAARPWPGAGRWPSRSSATRPPPGRAPPRAGRAAAWSATACSPARPSLAEGVPGGFAAVYSALADLETLGACRRGYFVEGLGGAQFAMPGAVERLRDLRDAPPDGEPARAGARRRRPGPALRRRGALAAARGRAARPRASSAPRSCWWTARPRLYLERGGRGLLTFGPPSPVALAPRRSRALAGWILADRRRRAAIERVDGEPVFGSPARGPAGRGRLPRRPARDGAARIGAAAQAGAVYRVRLTGREVEVGVRVSRPGPPGDPRGGAPAAAGGRGPGRDARSPSSPGCSAGTPAGWSADWPRSTSARRALPPSASTARDAPGSTAGPLRIEHSGAGPSRRAAGGRRRSGSRAGPTGRPRPSERLLRREARRRLAAARRARPPDSASRTARSR